MTKKIIVTLAMLVGLMNSAWAVDKSHYYSYIVKDKYMKKICFEPVGLNDFWEEALYNAVNNYNNSFRWRSKINFAFRFISESSCSYRVKVKTEKNNDPYYLYYAITNGCHSWLKKPCDSITINLSNTYKISYGTEMTALLMHEMGHVIGLNHTGSGNGIKIPGTSNDQNYLNSLYRAGGNDDYYPGSNEFIPNFTRYDTKSLLYMY